MPVYNVINEDINMETRLRVKEEYKEQLINNSDLRWEAITGVIKDIYWKSGGYGHDWQYHDGYNDVSTGFLMIMVDTIIDRGTQELYSELSNPPANIKTFQNKYFEIEYLD